MTRLRFEAMILEFEWEKTFHCFGFSATADASNKKRDFKGSDTYHCIMIWHAISGEVPPWEDWALNVQFPSCAAEPDDVFESRPNRLRHRPHGSPLLAAVLRADRHPCPAVQINLFD